MTSCIINIRRSIAEPPKTEIIKFLIVKAPLIKFIIILNQRLEMKRSMSEYILQTPQNIFEGFVRYKRTIGLKRPAYS